MTRFHHSQFTERIPSEFCRYGRVPAGRFARMFPELPPLYVDAHRLAELGAPGGPLDGGTTPARTETVPVGHVFFGQFVDHDITLDVSSSLTSLNEPTAIDNVRTPTLDLDCVYGDGPEAHPFLYRDGIRLATGEDQADSADPDDLRRHDLLRTPTGTAVIGDPRNDENRIVSQMQLAVIRLHNRVVEEHGEDFARARRITTWHYQWTVLHDLLPTLCGSAVVDDILAHGRRLYRPERDAGGEPYIPVEFAVGCYRFGHAMVPQSVRIRAGGPAHDLFGPVLGPGFRPLSDPAEVVDWNWVFGNEEQAKRLEAKLARVLLDLPFLPAEVPPPLRSLATRNLLRGQSFLLPSGERIAELLLEAGDGILRREHLETVRQRARELGFYTGTPLWLYTLLEGELVGRAEWGSSGVIDHRPGEGLGPLGGRIVAEVLIGLMELDPRAFLGSMRNWSPLDAETRIGDGLTGLRELFTAVRVPLPTAGTAEAGTTVYG